MLFRPVFPRYVDELYDTVQAVPRHGDWEIDRPGVLSQAANALMRGNVGLPVLGGKKVTTLEKGTKVGGMNIFSMAAKVGAF